ncbi:hypothetical protein GGF32_007138 [Allomyces javanicus]|nr:hypothetical protein GGF32_007138 [Allomyces javanicus]
MARILEDISALVIRAVLQHRALQLIALAILLPILATLRAILVIRQWYRHTPKAPRSPVITVESVAGGMFPPRSRQHSDATTAAGPISPVKSRPARRSRVTSVTSDGSSITSTTGLRRTAAGSMDSLPLAPPASDLLEPGAAAWIGMRTSMSADYSSDTSSTLPGRADKYKRKLRDLWNSPLPAIMTHPRHRGRRGSGTASSQVSMSSAHSGSTATATALPDVAPLAIVRTPASVFASLADFQYPDRYFTLPNGLRVHYIDVDPIEVGAAPGVRRTRNGRTMILLHGALAWSYHYRKIVPILLDLGYRVIAIDFPGHGKSDKPMQPSSVTLGLYVSTLIEFFTSILHPLVPQPPTAPGAPPSAIPIIASPVFVVAQGMSAAVAALAIKDSPAVSMGTAGLTILSGYAPPHRDAIPALDQLPALLAATAASICRVAVALHRGLASWVPRPSRVAAASCTRTGTTVAGYDTPYTGGSAFPVAPLASPLHFPVPVIGEIPIERVAAVFAPGTAASKGLDPAPLTTGERWAARLARVAHVLDRETALEMDAAKLALREWASTGTKVAVMWGRNDRVWPVALGEWWADLCDAPLRVFDGAGHYLAEDEPVRLAHALDEVVVARVAERSVGAAGFAG